MDSVRLTYQTAVATLIQFISMSFLTFANETNSVVTACRHNNNCTSNLLSSLVFFIIVAAWFGLVWMIGYSAQEQRSKRLAQLLIIAELAIAVIGLFNAKHHPDILSLFTSLLDIALALWVINLAWRLMRSRGGRVVSRQRSRRRPTPPKAS
jgi:membrane-associated HD superfamily phosphohydrolase